MPPKGAAPSDGRPGAPATAPADTGEAGGAAAGGTSEAPVASATTENGSTGMGIALGIAGGLLVLLGGGAFLVNRRWPLPDLVRRRR
ncbi:D-alanyl-D-alanine carboxypeptidase OS=Streptomyces glaucescens OX=1907 GN=SGLAU_20855 PE=4 SV=1 [Streptomyces glaucescens]